MNVAARAFAHPELREARHLFLRRLFAYDGRVGINRRAAELEIALAIRDANRAISSTTLGQLCAASVVSLDVACYQCPRKGRYRLTRLIDQHGAGESLPSLKRLLTADCPRRNASGFYNQCGAYFPQALKPDANR